MRRASGSEETHRGFSAAANCRPSAAAYQDTDAFRVEDIVYRRGRSDDLARVVAIRGNIVVVQMERSEGNFRAVRKSNPGFKKWCICGGARKTAMIACENAHCKTEWFHFECAGVTEAEATGDGFKWLCSKCPVVAAPSSSMPEAAGPMDLS